jgi:hypothetical protein
MRTVALVVATCLVGCAASTEAQIVPPVHSTQAIVDPAMIFEDRGQKLELYPALRATPETAGGAVQHRIVRAEANAPIGPRNLGVLFNHTLQARGFLTGEITFKPKGDGPPVGFDPATYPGLAKVTNPNIYEVVATSPKAFMLLFNHLKARSDLEWVEAVVIYGPAANDASVPAPGR